MPSNDFLVLCRGMWSAIWLSIACLLLWCDHSQSFYHRSIYASFIKKYSSFTLYSTLTNAIDQLRLYDSQYRDRMRQSKAENVTMALLDFRRAQELKATGLAEERQQLKQSCEIVKNYSDYIVLGIMTSSGAQGIEVLRRWVDGLGLSRGILRAVNDMNEEVDYQRYLNTSVYIKYNSSDHGNAYMKEYLGSFVGVIFQPSLSTSDNNFDKFQQYGNLPLTLF